MSIQLRSHPFLAWVAVAAVSAAGLGYRAGSVEPVSTVDGVVVDVTMVTYDLHIPQDSPVWEFTPTLCNVAQGLLAIMGGVFNCDGDFVPPEPDSMDYTLYVTPGGVRMDFSGQSMLAQVAPDGSFGDWGVLDPASGQLLDFQVADEGRRGLAAVAGSHELAVLVEQIGRIWSASEGPQDLGSETRSGHEVDMYQYQYKMGGALNLPDGNETGIVLEMTGMARYATAGPFTEDGDVATVVESLSPYMLFSYLEPDENLGLLRRFGMLLRVDEVMKVWVYLGGADGPDIGGEAIEALRGQSHTVITDARREAIPAEMFAALSREEQGCDCSCASYEELKRFSEMSREEQEQYPRLMAMATCARECMRAWAACVR